MPAFQKIGGLFTNSMAGDTVALHAAVIAVNQALSGSDTNEFLGSLLNTAANLNNIEAKHVSYYYEALREAKEIKTQAALNRVSKQTMAITSTKICLYSYYQIILLSYNHLIAWSCNYIIIGAGK